MGRHSDPQGQHSGGHQSKTRSLRRGDAAAGVGGGPTRMRQGRRAASGVPRTLGAARPLGRTGGVDCWLGDQTPLCRNNSERLLPSQRSVVHTAARDGHTGPHGDSPSASPAQGLPCPPSGTSDGGEQHRTPGRSSSRTTNFPSVITAHRLAPGPGPERLPAPGPYTRESEPTLLRLAARQ